MNVACTHCGSQLPVLSVLRLATGTVASCRCRGCSRVLGLSRVWERAFAAACWLSLGLAFVLSMTDHSYVPYLVPVLVILAAVVLAFRSPPMRVIQRKANWFPVLNAMFLGIFFCAMVYATPL